MKHLVLLMAIFMSSNFLFCQEKLHGIFAGMDFQTLGNLQKAPDKLTELGYFIGLFRTEHINNLKFTLHGSYAERGTAFSVLGNPYALRARQIGIGMDFHHKEARLSDGVHFGGGFFVDRIFGLNKSGLEFINEVGFQFENPVGLNVGLAASFAYSFDALRLQVKYRRGFLDQDARADESFFSNDLSFALFFSFL